MGAKAPYPMPPNINPPLRPSPPPPPKKHPATVLGVITIDTTALANIANAIESIKARLDTLERALKDV